MPLSLTATLNGLLSSGRLAAGLVSLAALPLPGLAAGAAPPSPAPQAAPVAPPVQVAPGAAAPQPYPPLSDEAFAALLQGVDPEVLGQACLQAIQEDRRDRLRQLQERILALHPSPQPLEVVFGDAELLLACKAPAAALTVLDRFGPGPGPKRTQWLLLQWRAATDALDHRLAALALERLTAGLPARLEALPLTLQRREDGTVVSRPALEVFAGHLESMGFPRAAAEVLLASRLPGVPGALRLQQAVRLHPDLPAAEREALFEAALEQAAAEGAWGLVAELLDEQAALPSALAVERRLRLSPRLDDAYGEWRMRQGDPASLERVRQLERQLRSPRSAGGHAPGEPSQEATQPVPATVAPAIPAQVPLPSSTPVQP
jgi:hypothetical protein